MSGKRKSSDAAFTCCSFYIKLHLNLKQLIGGKKSELCVSCNPIFSVCFLPLHSVFDTPLCLFETFFVNCLLLSRFTCTSCLFVSFSAI